MMDLLRRAIEATRAEHAWAGGIHTQKGCHGCVVMAEFRRYVDSIAHEYPTFEPLLSASADGKLRFAIWVAKPLTHAKWELLKRYLDIAEPDQDPAPQQPAQPEGEGQ